MEDRQPHLLPLNADVADHTVLVPLRAACEDDVALDGPRGNGFLVAGNGMSSSHSRRIAASRLIRHLDRWREGLHAIEVVTPVGVQFLQGSR